MILHGQLKYLRYRLHVPFPELSEPEALGERLMKKILACDASPRVPFRCGIHPGLLSRRRKALLFARSYG